MKSQRPSIDGFIPRRASDQLGGRHTQRAVTPRYRANVPPPSGLQRPTGTLQPTGLQRPVRGAQQAVRGSSRTTATSQTLGSGGLSRRDIDESLSSITTAEPPKKRKWGFGGKKSRTKKQLTKKQRIIKWAIIVVVAVMVTLGAWMAYKVIRASGNVFKGNIFGLVQSQPLKTDANGRSNILILGTSEDDPGHGGAYLTDSMMIVSIDQTNKTASMFSIPRDLYVEYGMACNSGYQGKINEYFNCVNDDWTSDAAEQQRLTETRKFIGDIVGLDIQYGVHINNTVIKDAVNAVGGVDVDIQGSNGDPGILDRSFDWRCNYTCNLVKYDNGVHHLDGEDALFLAMARGHVAPTYGLGNSNFDREKNQQKIIVALKEKAVSTGTLTDLSKVTGLIDSLGNNLRTTFETSEIRTLMQLGIDIPVDNIKSVSLSEEGNEVVTSGNYNGASVVMPSAGIFNYSELQAFLRTKLSNDPVTREGAGIAVLNGSEIAGVAQSEADKLTEAGFIVSVVDNAPAGTYADVEIYQVGEGMTATKAKLEAAYGVLVQTTAPPVMVSEGTNFVVIFGKDRSSN